MRWLIILLLLTGCKTVKYIPIETSRTDTVYIFQQKTDSIFQRDSIYIEIGDTVKEYRYKYIYEYKDRVDTLYINRIDSIPVPYPVEKELTRWQRTKQDYGGFSIAMVLVVIFIVFGKMVYKLRK